MRRWLLALLVFACVLPAAASVSLLVCGGLTVHQIGFWSNSETLFEHAAHVTSNNYFGHSTHTNGISTNSMYITIFSRGFKCWAG